MSIDLSLRRGTLAQTAELLKKQQVMKLDANVGSGKIRSEGGLIGVTGLSALDDTETQWFRPTDIAIGHLSERFGVPAVYLRKLHAERPDIFDANLNGWLSGDVLPSDLVPSYAPDDRIHFLRTFSEPGETGILRAVLSNAYGTIDNLDVLTACLEAIRDTGADVTVTRCDLTERRMNIRFAAPGIAVQAPVLLAGYKSPFTGLTGAESDVVHAGFDLGNGETGGTSFTLDPVLEVVACKNGLTQNQDRLRKIHLGGRMDEGIVRISDTTRRRNMELAASQAKDAVETFLDADYVRMALDRMEAFSSTPLGNPAETVELVAKKLRYTEEETAGILDHFIKGGQTTAGGIMQAVTSWSQTIDDPDRALDFEATGVEAMEFAASIA